MLKYLMLMPLHTAVHRYLPLIDGWNGRNKGSIYEQCIREVEMGSFTPLVFSTFGGMGHASTVFYRRLAFLQEMGLPTTR